MSSTGVGLPQPPPPAPSPGVTVANEISSISIPPRSCCQVTSIKDGAHGLQQSGAKSSENMKETSCSSTPDVIKSERKTIRLLRGMSQDMDRQESLVKSPSVTSLPADMNNIPNSTSSAAEPRQSSITINFYRRPLNPILISNKNTAVASTSRQDSPKISNGSACLSLVKPTVQAQECSSEDLTVTVPPIRSEVVLNVSQPQAMASTQVCGPVCPRPMPGPLQPGPAATDQQSGGLKVQSSTTSTKTGIDAKNPSSAKYRVAHFNLPRVRPYPYRSLFPVYPTTSSHVVSSQSSIMTQPGLASTSILASTNSSNTDRGASGGISISHSAQENSQNKDQPVAEAINGAGLHVATSSADTSNNITPQPNNTRPKDLQGVSNPSIASVMSSSSCSGTTCSSSTGSPTIPMSTVSNLPPRPPSLKKPNLGPLQPSPSTTSLGSPSTSSPLSHISPPRRLVNPSPNTPPSSTSNTKNPPGAVGVATPITSPGRGLAPLQTNLFQHTGRRTSVGSQDSVSSCLTPTKSTPPSNLPLGRFPCLQSPTSNSSVPPMYQPHGVSPVTSPYQDSPSNSRPPSWYGYRMFRGRDSSPSATSRDSLDSFIRSPPSGIFCTRNSVDNLIASRSSMDNISDTSGDSVFDDIMSESEKKSLDDTAESCGSMGSLTIADQLEGAVCLDHRTPHGASHPDGAAASQVKVPAGGTGSKRDSMNMSTAGETASSNQSDVEGGPSMPATPPVLQEYSNPMTNNQGQMLPNNQGQVPLPSMGPEPPPSYEEAIGLVPEGASSSHLLTYKDFVPAYNPQRRVWEPFNKVVLQANEWLVLNPEVRISSCESVLGFAAQSHGFNPDRAIGTRSQVSHENTYNLRFLRIWYSRLDQTSSDIEPQQIRYANFVSPAENGSINTLVDLINTKLNTVIKGDILNVETIYILRKAIQCPDTPCWIERPHDPKAYSFFLRMFWLEPQEERQELIKLGYMDFVPQHASGKNYPNDYEPFAVLVQVAQWWASHKAEPGANIINCQSLYVKRKALSTYWQRLHYTESAGGNNFLKNTYYNQILRFYFQTPTSCLGVPVSPTLQISCRTFTPVQLTSPTDPCLKFESFGETVNRVLHWLRLSGAQLMSIETIKIRMYGGLQGPHGAESTLMRSEGRRYADQEHWIHCIRVYLVGEYREPDSSRIPPIPHVVPYFTTSPRPIALLPPTVAFL